MSPVKFISYDSHDNLDKEFDVECDHIPRVGEKVHPESGQVQVVTDVEHQLQVNPETKRLFTTTTVFMQPTASDL